MLLDLLGYSLRNNLRHLRRDGIAHHFISRRNVIVFEDEFIGERLDTSAFTHTEAAVLILVSRDKDALVGLNKLHLWCTGM